jgi:transcriptional regulator with XRE-family HTH domain
MSIPEAADAIGYSRQTVARIEQGTQPSRTQQIESLCKIYRAPAAQLSYFTALAVASNQSGWWEPHKGGTIPAFRVYAEAEQEASFIEVFESEYIPGIVQTEAYMRALQEWAPAHVPVDDVAVRAFRMRRQALLFGRRPMPTIHIVIGMAALAYLRSIPSVRDEQFARLLELSELPTVDIWVVDRLHTAMGPAFTIVNPRDAGSAFVYMDAFDGCRYVEDEAVVSFYHQAFGTTRDSASPIKEYMT